MATDWSMAPLGDLTDNFDGKRIPVKEADRRTGPYPYYGASGVVDYVDDHIFDGDYLLVAEDGENLRTMQTPIAFMASGKFWVNNHAHIVRGNARADTRFLMYALRVADVSAYLSGSTMPKLTQGNLNKIPVPEPPLIEQRSIAHILGTLDDKIELNRKMNQTLEAMARAIFKSWFVDFDPVRAKAEGRDPGLPPDLAALFPDSFEDSELGEIPKGWRVGSVQDLASLSRDSVNPSEFPAEQFYHFSIPAFDDGRVPKTELGAEIKSNKFIVPSDSVLLSKLNPRIPRVWLPNTQGTMRSICSTEFLVALPKEGISREYLFSLFTSPTFVSTFATLVTGTSGSHQRVKPEGLLDMQVIVPSDNLIPAYTKIVKPLIDQATKNIYLSRTLAALRDALLPKLLSGEIRLNV